MSLIQVATNTVTSAVASVTLTGIDSDDVYMVAYNNATPSSNNVYLTMRVTESGTANTTSNYDAGYKNLRADASFSESGYTNISFFYLNNTFIGTGESQSANGLKYIFNANNGSENTFFTNEVVIESPFTATVWGNQGGEVFTSDSAVDGVQFLMSSGNIASGTFTLYKVL